MCTALFYYTCVYIYSLLNSRGYWTLNKYYYYYYYFENILKAIFFIKIYSKTHKIALKHAATYIILFYRKYPFKKIKTKSDQTLIKNIHQNAANCTCCTKFSYVEQTLNNRSCSYIIILLYLDRNGYFYCKIKEQCIKTHAL